MSTTIFATNPITAPDVAGLMTEAALAQGHTMRIDDVVVRDVHRHHPERFTEYKLRGAVVPAGTDQLFRFDATIAAVYEAQRGGSTKAVLINQSIEVFDVDGIRHMHSAENMPTEWNDGDEVDGAATVAFIIANTKK